MDVSAGSPRLPWSVKTVALLYMQGDVMGVGLRDALCRIRRGR